MHLRYFDWVILLCRFWDIFNPAKFLRLFLLNMASSDDILKSVSLAIESENKQKLEFLFTSLNKKLKNLAFLSSEDICDRYQQGKLFRNFLALSIA